MGTDKITYFFFERSNTPELCPQTLPLAKMHLQWFAAEDEGRTEEPTEHKIQEARKEGRVAKSQDLSSSVVLLLSVVTLGLAGSYIFGTFQKMFTHILTISTSVDITKDSGIYTIFLQYFVRTTAPIAIVAFVAALAGNLFQVGFLFTTKPLKPDLKKIMPKFAQFFKRSLFSSEALFNLMKNIGKIAIIGFIAFLNIRGELPKIATLIHAPFLKGFSFYSALGFRILTEAAVAMLVLAIFDYMFQRHQYRESLKMSRHEVKEERKMYEGDPQIQQRLKERMQQILSQNMMRNVPEADVVVTNPTHFAVGIQWDRMRMEAPAVIAKGQDNIAFRIREIAQANDVPLIENKPLARALFHELEIGDEIPPRYYEVMAIIFREVYAMKGIGKEEVS
jgi:flagellar biosynthesis protein FlhB